MEVIVRTKLGSLIEPVQTPDELNDFIINNWGIALPWDIVDEQSTSSSLKFLWQIYYLMLTGEGANRHVLAASRNTAKCIKIGTLVATPTGPVEIQDLKIGDTVYDEHGKEIKVIAVHDQGIQECVDLAHRGKIWATCTPNHRWQVTRIADKGREKLTKIAHTKDIKEKYKINRIIINEKMGNKNIPEAYFIGSMLGDGSCTGNGIVLNNLYKSVADKAARTMGTTANNWGYCRWGILSRGKDNKKIHSDYYEKWCRGKKSYEKTLDIEELKTWDRVSLLELAAGLIDTDGCVHLNETNCRGKTEKQLIIYLNMSSKSIIEGFSWIINALWQVQTDVKDSHSNIKHGIGKRVMYKVAVKNLHSCKRILRELDNYLVLGQKKYKREYDELFSMDKEDRTGFKVKPAGKHHCYDITVDSSTSLYCLQNGLVTHNTLTSAMIQFFGLVHYRRDGLHLASTIDQSYALIKYIDKFLRDPILEPYTNTDNVRQKLLKLPPNDFTQKMDASLQVATATKRGTNSQRSSLLTFDEVDLTPREVLSEAAFIADPSIIHHKDGSKEKRNSIFIYLSSRKTNDGPIQELISESEQAERIAKNKRKRIKLHKWSMVDWMEKCPESQHLPEKGSFTAHMNTDTLETIWDEEEFHDRVPGATQNLYNKLTAFEGCRDCSAWMACQGRSVKQRCTSFMLRTAEFIGDVLMSVGDVSAIIAQALNWKPETKGIVFKDFSYRRHVKAPIDFYEWVTFGEKFNPKGMDPVRYQKITDEIANCTYAELKSITPTKIDIYNAMIEHDWTIVSGVDWGYNPDPAITTVVGYHKKRKRAAVLHTEAQTQYSNHVWAQYSCENIFSVYPVEFVAPDMADPSCNTYFKPYGVRSLSKKPPKIITGVAFLRSLMWNPHTSEYNFCILDDSFHFDSNGIVDMKETSFNGNALVMHEFTHWTHAKDPLGRWKMDKFDENHNNHTIDALRYALHPFTTQQSLNFSVKQQKHTGDLTQRMLKGDSEAEKIAKQKLELKRQFQDHMAEEFGLTNVFRPPSEVIKRQEETIKKVLETEDGDAKDKKAHSKRTSGIKFVI